MNTDELSTGGGSPSAKSKKREGEKRTSPCTPLREKGKGKELQTGFLAEPSFARAHAYATGRGASPPECIRPCLCPRRPERQDLAQFRHDKAGIQQEAKKNMRFSFDPINIG